MDGHAQWMDMQLKTCMNCFFGDSAIHDSQLVHDLFSEHTSPTIMNSDQTTYQTIANAHNNNITRGNQSYHDLAKI